MTADDRYFSFRRLAITRANVFPYPLFTQPFHTGAWETGQSGVGWYYDAGRQLALNDGTYGDTQFLHVGFALLPAGNYDLSVVVEPHPSGLANFGSLTIYFGNFSLTLDATPGTQTIALPNVAATDHFYFLVNGTCRIALKSVSLVPR